MPVGNNQVPHTVTYLNFLKVPINREKKVLSRQLHVMIFQKCFNYLGLPSCNLMVLTLILNTEYSSGGKQEIDCKAILTFS